MAAALDAGWISYSHVRAISRLARPGEEQLVGDLPGVAEHGSVGQLETVVRGLRTAEDSAAGDDTAREYLQHGWAAHSSQRRLSARPDPERGAVNESAVAQVAAAEGISARDALVRIAEIGLAALNRRAKGIPRGLRGHERAAVLIHLDVTALPVAENIDAATATEPVAEVLPRSPERGTGLNADRPDRLFARIAHGPGLPRSVVERLLCACRVRVSVLDGDRNDLDVGRTKRPVDDRMFRAPLIRDQHCTHPGCTSRHELEAHHVIHWLYGGRTYMANLVLLCSQDHHAHHDGKFSIERVGSRRRGPFTFRRPDGSVLPHRVDPSHFVDPDVAPIETEYPHIADTAMLSKSVGYRLDRAWVIAVLAHRRKSATPAPRSPAARASAA